MPSGGACAAILTLESGPESLARANVRRWRTLALVEPDSEIAPPMGLRDAVQQLEFLGAEAARIVNRRRWRWLTVWVSPGFAAVATYRIDRAFFLLFGRVWGGLRLLFFPVFLLFRLLGARSDIHYRARIDRGLIVLHPVLGVVVNGRARIGRNLVLTGGNCIGLRGGRAEGEFVIGDDVTLGANAVVLGAVCIGSRVLIGAGAVVVDDAGDDCVLIGVPAREA